jgi:hypothetical protein
VVLILPSPDKGESVATLNERTQALIDWAFQDTVCQAVVACGTPKSKQASLRVLAKAVWGFEFQTTAPRQTRLVTETRVHIADPISRHRFGFHWRLIGPFSGLIRQELLRLVKEQAENKNPDAYI